MKVIQLNKGFAAIVDDEDFDSLAQYRWHYDAGYAVRTKITGGGKKKTWMHREIMGDACAGKEVDHRNLDKLDNRRENLRAATATENRRNRPHQTNNKLGMKGVHWRQRNKKFVAQIKVDGVVKHLGYFKNPVDAHAAYREAATKLHGEFARFN